MELHLTSSVLRVLQEAGTRAAGRRLVSPADLLLALLAQEECLATKWSAEQGLNRARAIEAWSGDSCPFSSGDEYAPEPTIGFSRFRLLHEEEAVACAPWDTDVEAVLATLARRLADHPRPIPLATEHLLLGLTAADHAVGQWLREQGLETEALQRLIDDRYGVVRDDSPLPLEEDPTDEPIPPPPPSGSAPPPRILKIASSPRPVQNSPTARVLRAIDASANRAREGLRVVEDYARFVLDDAHLTASLKEVRHALTDALRRLAPEDRLRSRETQRDVGAAIVTQQEFARADAGDVLAANFPRLQEALRSLEEFGKLVDVEAAAAIERIRYETYTLHKAAAITERSIERLRTARLYVLLDGRESIDAFRRMTDTLIAEGVDILQLRDKRLDDRELLDRARLLRERTANTDTLFIVNDRPDIAALCRADGVHVGQEELSIHDVRSVVGPRVLIGLSTHSIEQARAAVLDGADYIGVGPMFPTSTKPFDAFPGVGFAREVASEIRLPAYAIGGVTLDRLDGILSTGVHGVAVSSAIVESDDPAETVRAFRDLVGR